MKEQLDRGENDRRADSLKRYLLDVVSLQEIQHTYDRGRN